MKFLLDVPAVSINDDSGALIAVACVGAVILLGYYMRRKRKPRG